MMIISFNNMVWHVALSWDANNPKSSKLNPAHAQIQVLLAHDF